jgi:hypothetical protein
MGRGMAEIGTLSEPIKVSIRVKRSEATASIASLARVETLERNELWVTTHHFYFTKQSRLINYVGEIKAVYCKKYIKRINVLCVQGKARLLMSK